MANWPTAQISGVVASTIKPGISSLLSIAAPTAAKAIAVAPRPAWSVPNQPGVHVLGIIGRHRYRTSETSRSTFGAGGLVARAWIGRKMENACAFPQVTGLGL
jgi:hypothetical protein